MLLHRFLRGEWGLLSTCGVRASHRSGFACCRTQVLGTQPSVFAAHRLKSTGSVFWWMGLVLPRHVGSSQIRDRAHVPCFGKQALYHWATKEAPLYLFLSTVIIDFPGLGPQLLLLLWLLFVIECLSSDSSLTLPIHQAIDSFVLCGPKAAYMYHNYSIFYSIFWSCVIQLPLQVTLNSLRAEFMNFLYVLSLTLALAQNRQSLNF